MRRLIKHILREQNTTVPGVPLDTYWQNGKQVQMSIPSKSVFFQVVKQIVEMNPANVLEFDDASPDDRAYEMSPVLKLFGINANYEALSSKIFWAAYDNRTGIDDDSINSFDELHLRPMKKYRVECYENWVEHVSYTWEPIVEAYSAEDAGNVVSTDEDGYYQYYEWDNEPGFE